MTRTMRNKFEGVVETTEEANLTLRIRRIIVDNQIVYSTCELIRADGTQVYNVQIGPKPDAQL